MKSNIYDLLTCSNQQQTHHKRTVQNNCQHFLCTNEAVQLISRASEKESGKVNRKVNGKATPGLYTLNYVTRSTYDSVKLTE